MFDKKRKMMIQIEGMSCNHCVNKVKNMLEETEYVKKVKVDLRKKEAIIWSSEAIDKNQVQKRIEDLGYQVVNIWEENR